MASTGARGMRSKDESSGSLLSYIDLETRLPPDHPPWAIRALASNTDLQVAIRGLGTENSGPYEGREMAQMLGAFAQMCSVFLRKLVLGDHGENKSRLLDEIVMETLEFNFQPLRRITPERRRSIGTGFGVSGGFMQVTKADEPRSGPVPT